MFLYQAGTGTLLRSFANPSPPQPTYATPLQVQLRREDGLGCWDATYGSALINRGDVFRAKSD